jgi:hypothetical protein
MVQTLLEVSLGCAHDMETKQEPMSEIALYDLASWQRLPVVHLDMDQHRDVSWYKLCHTLLQAVFGSLYTHHDHPCLP